MIIYLYCRCPANHIFDHFIVIRSRKALIYLYPYFSKLYRIRYSNITIYNFVSNHAILFVNTIYCRINLPLAACLEQKLETSKVVHSLIKEYPLAKYGWNVINPLNMHLWCFICKIFEHFIAYFLHYK